MKIKFFLLFIPFFLCSCTHYLFYPEKEHLITPDQIKIKYENIFFPTTNQLSLHGWFLPARTKKVKGTVLFLHGNAQNISTHFGSVYWLPAKGYNVFAFDYRGYGKSQGKPSLPGVEEDVQSALSYLLHDRHDIDREKIFVFAQSLGGSVGIVSLAHSPDQEKIKAMIVEGAFSSTRKIVREKLALFWLTWPFQYPLSFLIAENNPIKEIKNIHIPIALMTSEDDVTVPPHHVKKLYQASNEPKELWILEGVGHIQGTNLEIVRKRMLEFFKD